VLYSTSTALGLTASAPASLNQPRGRIVIADHRQNDIGIVLSGGKGRQPVRLAKRTAGFRAKAGTSERAIRL
jgi:hypothetical protein